MDINLHLYSCLGLANVRSCPGHLSAFPVPSVEPITEQVKRSVSKWTSHFMNESMNEWMKLLHKHKQTGVHAFRLTNIRWKYMPTSQTHMPKLTSRKTGTCLHQNSLYAHTCTPTDTCRQVWTHSIMQRQRGSHFPLNRPICMSSHRDMDTYICKQICKYTLFHRETRNAAAYTYKWQTVAQIHTDTSS